MKNTLHSPLGTYRNPTEFKLPPEYIFGNVFGNEEAMSEDTLSSLQAGLLNSVLSSGNIPTFAVHEVERLQELKLTRRPIFNRDIQSIPLRDIVKESKPEIILETLSDIGARSCVFERYAWR